ncbi:MAG: MarR family winged helix-turn-helix transcriptional regulator [Gammaproteobacteria bacterium]
MSLWVVLARAFAAIQARVAEEIRRHDLTPGEFGVLEALYHTGPQLLGELKRRVLVSSGGMTYLVDRLEARKLVTRAAAPGDRRARLAMLSPQGKAMIENIFPAHARDLSHVMGGLTPAEQQQARRLLRRLGTYAAELSENRFQATPELIEEDST